MGAINEVGNRYGKLVVLERDFSKPKSNKNCYWLCQCDCGNQTIVIGTKLRKGETKSCGCLRKENGKDKVIDMTNQKFGHLTVIERAGSSSSGIAKWRCLCDCGKETIVLGSHLRDGHTISCGCIHNKNFGENNIIDITNQKFGLLTAIKRLDKKKGTNYIWKCQCDCGQYCEADINSLTQGKKISCGCLSISKGELKIKEILEKNNIFFEQEKTFDNCYSPKTNYRFKFDFFVNNKYIIEFDGEQHFYYYNNNGWNTKESFEKNKFNDECKNNWCIKNNIPIIRIPYWYINNIKLEDLQIETSKFLINREVL